MFGMNNETHDTLTTLKGDVRDGVDEAKNRAQAAGEKLSRDVQGDHMSIGDRIASNVKEAGHNVAAEFDKTKREVRHADDDTTADTTAI
jgi:hypothetical protein